MESARTFLWLTFSALCVFLYIEWSNQDTALGYDSKQENPAPRGLEQTLNTSDESSESFQENLPSINSGELVAKTNNIRERSETTTISNNVLSITVDSKGADIIGAKLLKYYPSKNEKDNNIGLMYVNDPLYEFHRLQSGLLSTSGKQSSTHIENYSLSSRGRDKLSFVWFSDDGTKVTKTLKLNPDSYLVEVTFLIENMSEQTESYVPYYQLVKDNVEVERSMFDVESYSFDGGIIYDGDSYEKQYADDLIDAPYKKTHTNGWFANIRHHFVVAVLPPAWVSSTDMSLNTMRPLISIRLQQYQIAISQPAQDKRQRRGFGIFIGPKLQDELTKARDGLEVSVDYGRLSFLAKPMFWALNKSHSFLGNWGLAIIFVTLMIKVIFIDFRSLPAAQWQR